MSLCPAVLAMKASRVEIVLLLSALAAACAPSEGAREAIATGADRGDGRPDARGGDGSRATATGETATGSSRATDGDRRAADEERDSRARDRVVLEGPNGPISLAYEIIDGVPIAEGDIVVPLEIRSATRIGRRWVDGVVPYVIDPDLPEPSRVDTAIAHWEEKTTLRFVARTSESDYVSFGPGTGCSSSVGHTGGKQLVRLSTGESASSVVAVGIDRSNDRVYWFFRRGFATVGTTTRADAERAHFRYMLPAGKTTADIVDVAFGAAGHMLAWYRDGTVSEGTAEDFAKYAAPVPYTLAPGKTPRDVAAFAIDGANQAHAFYVDGTFSTGTTTVLDATGAPVPYVVAAGKSLASLAHVDIAKAGTFHAFYTDGRTSAGTATNLGGASPLTKVSFPGNCGVGATLHEIGHSVGLFHEQTRSDRDDYVSIGWNNIEPGQAYNFEKYPAPTGNDTGPYDLASIMHYDSFAFSVNGLPTIVKANGQTFVANRTALSDGDIAAALFMYPAPAAPDAGP